MKTFELTKERQYEIEALALDAIRAKMTFKPMFPDEAERILVRAGLPEGEVNPAQVNSMCWFIINRCQQKYY